MPEVSAGLVRKLWIILNQCLCVSMVIWTVVLSQALMSGAAVNFLIPNILPGPVVTQILEVAPAARIVESAPS